MHPLNNLKLGLAFGSSGEPVIVITQTTQGSFGVWNQHGVLWIYDRDQGDVIEPLWAQSVWDAMVLFNTWCCCSLDGTLLE